MLKVEHKFGGRESERRTLSAFRANNQRRHGRSLSTIDLPLGGDGSPTGAALYFTKIGLGTPSKDYYLQVDTGSDIIWVNCAGCDNCPKKSSLNIPLTLYNPKASTTGSIVTCDQEFCGEAVNLNSCKVEDMCQYKVTYGDGSSSGGYFVTANIQLNKASSDFQTTPVNGSVSFGDDGSSLETCAHRHRMVDIVSHSHEMKLKVGRRSRTEIMKTSNHHKRKFSVEKTSELSAISAAAEASFCLSSGSSGGTAWLCPVV